MFTSPASWGPGRATSVLQLWTPALGRRRLPDHRPVPATGRAKSRGQGCVRPRNSRPSKRFALAQGFLLVSSSPLTRSSYHAGTTSSVEGGAAGGKRLRRSDAARCWLIGISVPQEHIRAQAGGAHRACR